MVLDSLGVAGDTDSRARLVEDLDDLVARWSTTSTCARSPSTRTARCSPTPRRWRSPAPRSATRRPGSSRRPRTAPHRSAAGSASPTRSATRSTGASGGSASCPTTTCSASSRDALGDADGAGAGADAAALADRAGRRVPGHRPGAVGGARPRVHRPRHDGADRRPEAGDLRLPRRRRHDLPRRPPRPRRPSRRSPVNWRSDAAAARRVPGAAGAAPSSATTRIVVHDVEAHHDGGRLVGAPQAGAVPGAGACAASSSAQRASTR